MGCTEMTRAEKNLCTNLTSKSYSYIPVCETEKSCFEKVALLFKTNLGYEQESNLYELKNKIARSWYFYNKAVSESKKISDACKQGNYASLAGEINQTENYMDNSFLELDEAMKKSFEVIKLEEKILSDENFDNAKEESTYDSLVELRQIISELKNGGTNSDSYVSYYLKKADSFNKSNAGKLKQNLVENTPFWIEDYDYFEGIILKKFNISQEGYFPSLSSALQNAINYFEAKFFTQQGIVELQNFPISDFMKLYSDMGGNNASALKRFADLINRTSKNLDSSRKELVLIEDSIDKEKKNCETLLEKINFYKKYDLLMGKLSVSEITNSADP